MDFDSMDDNQLRSLRMEINRELNRRRTQVEGPKCTCGEDEMAASYGGYPQHDTKCAYYVWMMNSHH